PEPNSYGFLVTCPTDPCLESSAIVYAGSTLYPANDLDVALQDQEGHTALLGVDREGHVSQVHFSDSKTEAPLPVLPAGSAPPAPRSAAAAPRIVTAGWTLPAAEAVAGVGLAAVLMGALYYLWPTLKGGFLGLFSRIEPERVLDHPARKGLHVLVEANPGIHFQELVRRTGFGRGQLEHHLRKLEHAGLVSRVKGDSYACFFARGQVDRRVMAAAPLLRSDGGRRVLAALQHRPGASTRDLAEQLGLAVGTVSYHVKRLREAGMLDSAEGSLHLTETGRQATALAA
ncbi:MAG TPA: winged helix-turn-helix transcriptional regulator, partial [Candidatus Thermoplasmatota archaeon]|nr:winged helix-turn-helix transcriptional regulator [Candidatus Thermoplasmatota archaeon]